MGKLYQRYVVFLYLKNFFIIFLALEFFYVGVDLLSNLKNLPSSANLQLLYVYYNFLLAINYTLPLSIVFALISSKLSMIRSNELVSLYASGISRNEIIKPLFISSLVLILAYIALNFTSFAYSYEFKRNILKYNKISSDSKKLFVKYQDKYIYFGLLNPIKKVARDIKIFNVQNGELKSVISSKRTYFSGGKWHFEKASKTTFPENKKLGEDGFKKEVLENISLLDGFKPSIIDTLHENKIYMSITDAYESIKFLRNQGANTSLVKSSLYGMIVFPLFAPFMLIILFFYMPPTGRFFNLALLGFVFIFVTLVSWGVIFVLNKFSANDVISAEFSTILPVFLMGLFALRIVFISKRK
ncbi:MAG: permease [Proteobacteria bacterium]|nr:MAG: permease [Pseudomonadota bacterium]